MDWKGKDRVNKHKPWIETSYHGVVTENNDTVILDPPLVALDKDAPVPFAGYVSGQPWVNIIMCILKAEKSGNFPGSLVVKKPPSNAGVVGLIPVKELRSCMLRGNLAFVPQVCICAPPYPPKCTVLNGNISLQLAFGNVYML
ncbi:hypothetical protein MJG53_000729 [Ovis ammon polii x Ovis aries]|uniref:Uncharacterized protein n=1 Tax=Ovis ammon polii x Ovis aries TaxID=2918886 RepID=A0ACB9VJY0_9CETA|nr:hypothetical protein MJG53_000729 [Ovis ammon polii x Ovis aries]